MTRFLLEGDTLQVGFHRVGKAPYPEDIVPAAVLRATSQQLKTDLQTQGIFWGDYCYFAGVTGEAFRFLEFMNLARPVPGKSIVERYGNVTVPDMYRLALEAAGYRSQTHLKGALPERAALQQQIVQSLRDRRTPVIGIGVFGPPEPFLITGYDESGKVLLGWSHFQGEKKADPSISFEATGQFRLSNWYEAIDGVVIVTGQTPKPSPRDIYRGAIERAIRELRTTEGAGGALGSSAMEKWALHLETDADFVNLAPEQLRKSQSDHSGTAGDLAERRALAESFIELARRVLPEAKDDLALAQAAFKGSHDTVYEIWETIARSGPFDPDLQKFSDPARRRTMATLVRRLADLDRRGTLCLERAMKVIDGKGAGAPIAPDALLDGNAVLEKAQVPADAQPWAPENIHIANSMGMLQAFLGESFGQLNDAEKSHRKLSYILWMGYSGAAFGMLADGPERSNLPLAMEALGYDYELWMGGDLAKQTGLECHVWGWDDNLRRRIFWNLRDRRLPVLLFNCGKWPDWWLVTEVQHWGDIRGYGGNNGEGYRPNEPLDHPRNPLREVHLFEGMKGKQTWTLNLTARRPGAKPSMEDLYRRAVVWGARKMREPRMTLLDDGAQTFVSANPYRDWARMMTSEPLFPADDPAALKSRRFFLEGHEVELAERRFYGASFLDLAAIRLSRPELKEAANRFRAVNRLVEQIWAQTGGLGSANGHLRYAEPDVRDTIANLLLEIEREESAASTILSR